MAMDRHGDLWIPFEDGGLYKVSSRDLSCEKTAFSPSSNPAFKSFGMAFAANGPTTHEESLYVSAIDGSGLGKIELPGLDLVPVGPYGSLSLPAELTGNADGRLFGLFPNSGNAATTIAELDTKSGQVVEASSPQQLGKIFPGSFGLGHWGGELWVFSSTDGQPSHVFRYAPGSTTAELVFTEETPATEPSFRFQGAAVSTCAPTTIPE